MKKYCTQCGTEMLDKGEWYDCEKCDITEFKIELSLEYKYLEKYRDLVTNAFNIIVHDLISEGLTEREAYKKADEIVILYQKLEDEGRYEY